MDKTDPVIVEFIHYSKWIMGSYGSFLPVSTESQSPLSIPKVVIGDEAAISFLVECIGATREDVLYSCLEGESITASSSTISPPPFFVLLDRAHKSIVLLVRGTKNLNDFVVDMSSASVAWEEGFAHEGIGLIAKHIARNTSVLSAIRRARDQYPDYSVRTVGHSLGAGIAALVAILWNNDGVFGPVECFAFAPPPVLTLRVKNRGESFVHCLINEDDMIPRLNATCVRELARRVEKAMDAKEREDAMKEKRTVRDWAESLQSVSRSVKRCAQEMLNGAMAVADIAVRPTLALLRNDAQASGESLQDQWNALRERSRRWIADEGEGGSVREWKCVVDELFLPGTVYYYHPCIGDFEEYMEYEREKSQMGMRSSVLSVLPSTVKYSPAILKMPADAFPQVLRVSPYMLYHHTYSAYEKCLQFYCEHSSQ